MRHLLGVAVLVAALASSPGWACRGRPRTLAQVVKGADVIFVGKLLKRTVDEKAYSVELEFEVEETLKGTLGKRALVHSDTTSCGWGRGLDLGTRVLVYADGPELETSNLEPNELLRDAKLEAALKASVRAAMK